MCRRLGVALAALQGTAAEAPVESGLLAVSMLERVWAYSNLYGRRIDQAAVERIAIRLLLATESAPLGPRAEAAANGRNGVAAAPAVR